MALLQEGGKNLGSLPRDVAGVLPEYVVAFRGCLLMQTPIGSGLEPECRAELQRTAHREELESTEPVPEEIKLIFPRLDLVHRRADLKCVVAENLTYELERTRTRRQGTDVKAPAVLSGNDVRKGVF